MTTVSISYNTQNQTERAYDKKQAIAARNGKPTNNNSSNSNFNNSNMHKKQNESMQSNSSNSSTYVSSAPNMLLVRPSNPSLHIREVPYLPLQFY
ncbi:basic-leucine zipper transcription factor B-like [Drosophila busckii]|uniref:basic-leucine zipper transcription factor B-like n=1 Tax=Drosophila busckii TaxID=30019 RepID=UPI00083EDD61|nr:basic-leucine zipper transcription factor B-like [Drosophila busckii]